MDQLKNPNDFRLIGKAGKRYDIPSKTNGSALFALDVRVPHMVYGVISRSTVYGAKPTLLNKEEILNINGIIDVVILNHGIGLITKTMELALQIKP